MIDKLKHYGKVLLAILMSAGTLVLIILKLKQGDIDEADLKDSYLEGQESKVDEDIDKLEDKLDDPIDDLTDEEVEDYWGK